MYGKTLDASDPAYANPSGDNTVAVAQNASPDSNVAIIELRELLIVEVTASALVACGET
jgi:hypothetical protein